MEKINITDPESRVMKDRRKVIQPIYNGQIAVDEKKQVIVAADVSQNATDHAEFKPLVEPVFGQLKWDNRTSSMELRGLVKVRGEFLLMCLVHNVKKIMKKVLQGTFALPRKCSSLIEEIIPGYRKKRLTLVGAEV